MVLDYILKHIDKFFFIFFLILLSFSSKKILIIKNIINKFLEKILNFIKKNKTFEFDDTNELTKVSLIRILFGFLITYKYYFIFLYDYQSFNYERDFFILTGFLSGICILFGFLTQFFLLFLAFIQFHIGDVTIGFKNLFNNISTILIIYLFFCKSGSRLSIDSILIKKNFSKLFLYGNSLNVSINEIYLCKFFAICSYWLLCLYSLSNHIFDISWLNGTVGPELLSSSFMSKVSFDIEKVFLNLPFSIFISKILMFVMFPWYLLILPGVFIGSFLKNFIIYWGVLFFILSQFILNLSTLGYIEFLLWLAIFWNYKFINSKKIVNVAYDDKCNLCDGTVRFLKFLDLFSIIKLRPLSKNISWLKRHGISEKQALSDLYGIDEYSNKVFYGYNFYQEISKRILFLTFFYPILIIGKVFLIGPIMYCYIAERRRRLFGICKLPSSKKNYIWSKIVINNTKNLASDTLIKFFLIYIILGFLFFANVLIQVHNTISSKKIPNNYLISLSRVACLIGPCVINVFNQQDLGMSHYWFTVTANINNKKKILPLVNYDGSRLELMKSDYNYFGFILKMKREVLDKNGNISNCKFFDQFEKEIKNFSKLYFKNEKVDYFIFEQFHKKRNAIKNLKKNIYKIYTPVSTCRIKF